MLAQSASSNVLDIAFRLILAFCSFGSAYSTSCKSPDILANILIVNLTGDINFTLHDRQNLSSYQLSATYVWDVRAPEGSQFDGFVCCLTDDDKDKTYQALDDIVIEKFHCRSHFGNDFYLHDENGSYVSCKYPCNGPSPVCKNSLDYLCLELRDGCHVIQKDHRNYTIPIQFGRKYTFKIFPYLGHFINSNLKMNKVTDLMIFCRHHLIESETLREEEVLEFCDSEQSISYFSTRSGPPRELELYEKIPDFFHNTVKLIFRWKAPHDVALGITPYQYWIYSSIGKDETNARQLSRSPEEELQNPYYNITVSDVRMGTTIEVAVTPYFDELRNSECNKSKLLKCLQFGEKAILTEKIPWIDACSPTHNISFCDRRAVCDNSSVLLKHPSPAKCICPHGFSGDGYSPEASTPGTGCQNFNACSVLEILRNVCTSEAICIDADPPSNEISDCRCPNGYIGDGKMLGSGCTSHSFIIGLSIGLFLLFTLGIAVLFSVYKYTRYKRKILDTQSSIFVPSPSGTYINPLMLLQFNLKGQQPNSQFMKPVFGWDIELDRSSINREEVIGRGNFGVVHKATLCVEGSETTVAVKSLAGIYTTQYIEEFLAEICLLTTLRSHENILHLIGVCTIHSLNDADDPQSPLMVTEYMEYGDLLHFLWDSREEMKRNQNPIYNLTEIGLHKIGKQVARGLHFLSQSKIIHGDVAARNMLVGENLKIKISDFGLANDVYRYGVIKCATERRVPFKWISPERMLGGSTPITWRSDVWSFGILLFELVTLGSTPYAGMDPTSIFQKLQTGFRIPKPSSCSDYLYQIMRDCWRWDASKRPGFNELEKRIASPTLSKNADKSLSIFTAVETVETIDRETYERDIGRRDSTTLPPDQQETQ